MLRNCLPKGLSLTCVLLTVPYDGFAVAAANPVPNAYIHAAVRTEHPPVIDGRMDDEVWNLAVPITNFSQVIPAEAGVPSEVTELRILFDSDNLYLFIRCYDSVPSEIVAAQMQRDASLNTDDHITIVIDPFDRARSGYEFQVSAAGGMRDGLVETDNEANYDWKGLWEARAIVDELGWAAEIAIPFKTISFNPDADRWGFNLERFIPRTNERIRWSSPLRNTSVRRLSAAGSVTGLSDLNQGMGLMIKPFMRLDQDLLDSSTKGKAGFDLFYNVTPSITLSATVNTDFAETEIDDRIVNLTRFPTFFPEKRDFFLRDAGVFEFGGIARSPLPFFSRRIGIVRGEEKEILAGVRLTGRHEDVRFGLMNVQMKEDDALGHKNLSVARAVVDVLEESSVGFIATHGDPGTAGDSTLGGVDFNYLHRDPASGNRITGNFWLMGTYTDPSGRPRSNSDPFAAGVRIGMPNEPWRWHVSSQFIGSDFNPTMGFVQRTDRRYYDGEAAFKWRPKDTTHWIRALDVAVQPEVWTFANNTIEQTTVTLPNITIDTRTNEQIYLRTFYDYDKLVDPFQIVNGVFIPTGAYDTFGVYGGFRTSTSKPAAFRFEGGYRSFYSGDRLDFLARLRLRPSAHFFGGLDYQHARIDLGADKFDVHIASMIANILFTPRLSWSNLVQWDNQSDRFQINSRLRWEFRPGQEVFVVYNEQLDTDRQQFTSVSRQGIVKLGLTFRF